MNTYYSSEKNSQILVSLMKAHGIRKVIASPGSTNICFVASLQCDPYFEIYSAVDERSAAYIACGLAAESSEPVALSCTGATASRNYIPGLTEAFNRNLPVLAVTSSHINSHIGHNIPQVTDRRMPAPNLVRLSVQLPFVTNTEEWWECETKVNQALLELARHGAGPVHINLPTCYSQDYSVKELPEVRVIHRYTENDEFPEINRGGGIFSVAIIVGAHECWSNELTDAVDRFCEKYNGVVYCDHTSNYKGKYGIMANLVAIQQQYHSPCMSPKLLIHIGEVSGAYFRITPKEVWRVSIDGEIRDTYKKLSAVFEMQELTFFLRYAPNTEEKRDVPKFYLQLKSEYDCLVKKIPELPFSSVWIAKQTASKLPENAVLHLGILNSLRSWNYFNAPASVTGYSNVGGFGIDGSVSTLLGAALAEPKKLFFLVIGDLAFFYDMNAIISKNVGENLRIMLVNNGVGFEMKYYKCAAPIQAYFGKSADNYFAAKGHFGSKSEVLVRHYAEDLGFTYLSASNKDEYLQILPIFTDPELKEHPILLEVFADEEQENAAQKIVDNLQISTRGALKKVAKDIIGPKNIDKINRIFKR